MKVKAKTEVAFDRLHKKKELGHQGLNLQEKIQTTKRKEEQRKHLQEEIRKIED